MLKRFNRDGKPHYSEWKEGGDQVFLFFVIFNQLHYINHTFSKICIILMKQELAFALLLILISGFSLKESHQDHYWHGGSESDSQNNDYHPLTKKFVLEFDHASRNGVPQDSNSFSVVFNGKKVKDFVLHDYIVHHELFHVYSHHGLNSIHFIGTGKSDGLGQTIDNVKLHRNSFCGYEDVIINGGFQLGHTLGKSWAIFPNSKIPGWKTTDNQLQIGWGRIYNPNWPEDTHIAELDANHNSNVYQEFKLDKWQRLVQK